MDIHILIQWFQDLFKTTPKNVLPEQPAPTPAPDEEVNTMRSFPYSATDIQAVMLSKGYKFFTNSKGHDLNLIGIRTDDDSSNSFNDWMVVIYDFNGVMNMWAFPVTTDPGVYYRENPANVDGTAIVVPGQYPGLWQIGLHQGKYTALKQAKPIKVYRDNDGDRTLDEGNIKEGIYGINMHRANSKKESIQVDKWSAGCQVFQDPDHFDFVMTLCQRQIDKLGYKSFTYTLLEDSDF